MGNYGCYSDCAEKTTTPLFTEAYVNLVRRRPMTSLVAHSKLIHKLVNLNYFSKGDYVSVTPLTAALDIFSSFSKLVEVKCSIPSAYLF